MQVREVHTPGLLWFVEHVLSKVDAPTIHKEAWVVPQLGRPAGLCRRYCGLAFPCDMNLVDCLRYLALPRQRALGSMELWLKAWWL